MKQLTTLASKIDWLFRNNKKGREYTYQEVANGISKYLPEGKGVGHTWVWKLRKGKLQKTGHLKLKAFSNFFCIPVTFFYKDDVTTEELAQLQQKTLAENWTLDKRLSCPHLSISAHHFELVISCQIRQAFVLWALVPLNGKQIVKN